MIALYVCLMIINACLAGYWFFRALDEDATWMYIFTVGFLLLIVFNVSSLNNYLNKENEKDKAICVQIPDAQWIADNNTCIKNGKVIL